MDFKQGVFIDENLFNQIKRHTILLVTCQDKYLEKLYVNRTALGSGFFFTQEGVPA